MTDSKIITYSPAYTLVPTYECFNRCSYCNFRTDPGQSPWLTLTEADHLLKQLQSQGICEILILSGEVHPHSPRRQAWFQRIYDLCELALSMGFLPHTNVGLLQFEEMRSLKSVNVSMGLMLEQITPQLQHTVHRHAPSKIPQVRLQQLVWAGELQIPFTTGLLLGIGETSDDWWESLDAIAQLHDQYGHIQEVILQPHSPGDQQHWQVPAFDPQQLPQIIAKARQILPADITLQIPPNLVSDNQWLLACLDAGARDLGGIGPKDEVNPDYPHPQIQRLQNIVEPAGWHLVPRLPVYPQYNAWLSPRLQQAVFNIRFNDIQRRSDVLINKGQMTKDEFMSELETALEFIRNVERDNPDKSAYQIANILRGYTRKNYTSRLWSTATGYHQDYIQGEYQGKLNGDVRLSGEMTDFGHFLASLSDQINQPGVQWSDLTQWTADHTAWAGDIGSAIIVYRTQYETLAVKSLSEALTRFARDSDYTADVAACVIGTLINSGRYPSVSQAIVDYTSTAYSQQVKTFIQQRFGGTFQGNKLKNPAAVEAKMAQGVFLFVRLSNAPDIVASMKDFWQFPDQLNLSNIVQPQRSDILAGTLHFLAHLVKFGGLEPLTFKPYRVPRTKWLGSLDHVIVNGSI